MMARFNPAFTDYSVIALESMSQSQLRREYSRMRDVAQKRVKRLREAFPEAKASKHRVQLRDEKGRFAGSYVGFRKLEDIDPRDLPKALSELSKFVSAKTSTVQGQRSAQRKTMQTLNEAIGATKGRPAVNKKNYWRVIKLLEMARKLKIVYDSEKIVELAEACMSLSDTQFNNVLGNLEKLVQHSDEFRGTLEEYMEEKHISRYQSVDMDEFIINTGW